MKEDERVVGVLQHLARQVAGCRVFDAVVTLHHLLKDIRHQEEKVWRHRVPLAEAAATAEPRARHSIHKDTKLQSLQDPADPFAPGRQEAAFTHAKVQTVPIHRVERFGEIQLQDEGGELPPIASLHKLDNKNEVFRD